jgi:hypothetical protein
MAAPTTYLTIIKRMQYRGDAMEEWSNSYALTGTTPADSGAWRTLFDTIVAQEKTLYRNTSNVVAGYGYDGIPASGDHAIWSVDLTVSPNTPVPGTLAGMSGNVMAGDQATWIRWGLDRFNSKGKRVYLRKYYHQGYTDATTGDGLPSAYVTALNAYGAKLWDGTSFGGRRICDKDGNTPIGHAVSSYVTTRTLKRRGKRPPT